MTTSLVEEIRQAEETLERTEEAFERSRGRITEADWRDALERAEGRLLALSHARCEGERMA
jgi:hypothetical protein